MVLRLLYFTPNATIGGDPSKQNYITGILLYYLLLCLILVRHITETLRRKTRLDLEHLIFEHFICNII